jgi:hypothetical protein
MLSFGQDSAATPQRRVVNRIGSTRNNGASYMKTMKDIEHCTAEDMNSDLDLGDYKFGKSVDLLPRISATQKTYLSNTTQRQVLSGEHEANTREALTEARGSHIRQRQAVRDGKSSLSEGMGGDVETSTPYLRGQPISARAHRIDTTLYGSNNSHIRFSGGKLGE